MNPKKILVVEDEGIILHSMAIRLKELGYEPHTAKSGQVAIEKVLEIRPDLILMDIKLKGGMDGYETADKISALLDVPIVYITGYGDKRTLELLEKAAQNGYLFKPINVEELKKAIQDVLNK